MSQFISRVDEVQNPGIGQQQVVQQQHVPRQGMVENIIQGIMPVAEKGIQRFTESRGEQVVQEAQQDLDTAIGTIQQHGELQEEHPFIARSEPELPESVKMSDAQFDVLRNAVSSGQMTRDRARLHAAKLVRQRVSEQPLFSDRIRQSASEFLGFDPMSEQTRQFFAAFPTEAQGERNSWAQNRWDQAVTIAESTGSDPEFIMRRMMEGEKSEIMKNHANNEYELDQISGREWLDQQNREDTGLMYNRVFQSVMQARQEGALTGAQDVARIIEQDKQQHLAEVASGYKGNTTDPEFVQYRKQVNDRYEDVQDYIVSLGADNINQEALERLETMQQLQSRGEFPDFHVIRDAAGDAGLNSLLDMVGRARNSEHLETMMTQFPALESVYNRLNRDNEQMQTQIYGAGRALTLGGDLSGIEEPVIDATASEMHSEGDEQQKDSVIQTLVDNGFEAKPISILATQSPRFASRNNVEWMKQSYEQEMDNNINSIASLIAASSRDATFEVDEFGRVEIIPGEETFTGPGFRELPVDASLIRESDDLTQRINLFGDAMQNRWDRELGVSREDHANRVRSEIQAGIDARRNAEMSSMRNRLAGYIDQQDMTQAQRQHRRIQERFPDRFTSSFEDILRAAGMEPNQ